MEGDKRIPSALDPLVSGGGLDCIHCDSMNTKMKLRHYEVRNKIWHGIFDWTCGDCGGAWDEWVSTGQLNKEASDAGK